MHRSQLLNLPCRLQRVPTAIPASLSTAHEPTIDTRNRMRSLISARSHRFRG